MVARLAQAAYTINGRVTGPGGKPRGGVTVRGFDHDQGSRDNPLGEPATTDSQGRYRIAFADPDFRLSGAERGGPDVFIRVFEGDAERGRSPVHRSAGRKITIDLALGGAAPAVPPHAFRVAGTVRQLAPQALAQAIVRACDQGLVRTVTLAQTSPARDGSYELGYDDADLLDPRKGSANLVVAVIGKDGATLARSELKFNAGRREIVHLAVDPDAESQASEWERVELRLQPALQGSSLAGLSAGDLSFVEKSAGIPGAQFAARVQAATAAVHSGLPEWFHYALLRQQLPAQWELLLETPEPRLQAALAAAQQERTVTPAADKELAGLWDRLRVLRAERVLAQPLPGRQLKMGELLEAARLDPATQRTLAGALGGKGMETLAGSTAPPAGIELDGRTLDRVRFALRTAEIAGDHLATVAAIHGDQRIQGTRDLARHYDLPAWQALVKRTVARDGRDLPADVEGDSPAARRAGFARRLYERVAAAHPTIAVAHGLSRRRELARNAAVQLLPRIEAADAGFDLAAVRVDAYLKDKARALKLSKARQEAVAEDLKKVQRLYRLKPETGVIARLLADRLDSAAAILRKGRGGFMAAYGRDQAFGRDTAAAIYRQAETAAAKAFALYAHFSPAINTLAGPDVTGACPADLRAIPHYAALFGSLDGCECEPCESVYSPAAYLTDLLAFLKTGVERDAAHPSAALVPATGLAALETRSFCNAQDQLVSHWPRRPDIADTLLSCRNAETLVPYVDLVLEVLENAVAVRPGGALQTSLPASQLAAEAEHFNAAAYDTLARAVFPFSLPFELAHVEEGAYLGKLGTTRGELLEIFFAFRTGDPLQFPAGDPHDLTAIRCLQDRTIARERLGLGANEWALIADEALVPARPLAATWGYATAGANWWHPLRNVDTLLTRSGLDYPDLLRLLRLKSFNPTGAIGLRASDAALCDPARMELHGLDAGALGYLSRMLRLRRALGWTLRDVDQALLRLPGATAAGRPVLDGAFLLRLSQLLRLKERFRLPLEELLAWWSPLDTADRSVPQLGHEPPVPSQFERLFLAGRSGQAQFDAFQLDAAGGELARTGQQLANQLAAIGTAIGLEQPELALLVARTVGNGAPLTLATLSLLYRHASLARALGLRIGDFLALGALIDIDPFAAAALSLAETLEQTLQSLRFVQRADTVKASGFSIAQLDYLLRQALPFDGETVAPTAQWIDAGLATLAAGLGLADPFEGVRSLVAQAAAQLGAGPAASASAETLLALLAQARAALAALAPDDQTAALASALVQTQSLLAAGAAVNFGAVNAALSAVGTVLDMLAEDFAQQTLRPQLANDLAGLLGVDPPVARVLLEVMPLPSDPAATAGSALLAQLRPMAAAPQADFPPALRELMYLLHKASLVIGRLAITGAELTALFEQQASAGWLDLRTLPVRAGDAASLFDGWARLVELFRLRDALIPHEREQLFSLFDIARQYQSGVTPYAGAQRRAYIAALAGLTGWNAQDVDLLVGRWDIGQISSGGGGLLKARFPAHFADERLPLRVLAAVQLLRRVGCTASEVEGWLAPQASAAATTTRVRRIRSFMEQRYGESWAEVARPLRDPLRELQRQALVAYLVHAWGLARPDDLFDHFLIDVEMSPCMMTSRLIQATASVQLFVQRVLLNLEPGLSLSDEAAEQWDWMKNYRVWEANRKIFLYPENWIEPGLRDDKTPFFKDLESEILQGDIDNGTAETALVHYLQKLHEVARLQICGQYLEFGNPSVLHVFGRTHDVPHHYYYRRGVVEVDVAGLDADVGAALDASWTPWERIDVDIDADHLIPIVYNRRIYLFWPVFASEDEAPLTHTVQALLTLYGKLAKLLLSLFDLIRGIGVGVIDAAGGAIHEVLRGIEEALHAPGLLQAQQTALDTLKNGLIANLGGEVTLNAQTMNGVLGEVVALVTSYETYLLSLLPAKRLEVKLAWSEYKRDSWSAKKTSANAVTFRDIVSMLFENLPQLPGLARQGVRRLFTFRAWVNSDNQLIVQCNVALPASILSQSTSNAWLSEPTEIGHFLLNSCAGQLEAVDTSEHIGFLELFTQATSQMLTVAQGALDALKGDRQLQQRGAVITPDDDPERPSALRAELEQSLPRHFLPPYSAAATPDPYRILARHQSGSVATKKIGFFYQDARRTFFCFPFALPAKDPGKPAGSGYVFFPFYHPYACALLENIERAGVPGIYQERYVLDARGRAVPAFDQPGQPLQIALRNDDVLAPPEYDPVGAVYNPPDGPRALRPVEEINFSSIGAYAQYNWELFFHIPLLIASRLSTNQKFRESQQWFHYIFNPTDASRGAVPEKYWRTRPFVERSAIDYAAQQVDELLQLLNADAAQPGLQELEWAVRKWRNDAFNPHLVARTRTTAFQKTVVMKYIDNLVAWGDSLFRRETRESVNEAMQLYILAAKLLGPRPRRIPGSRTRVERSFRQLEAGLDAFSNALVSFENYLPAGGSAVGASAGNGSPWRVDGLLDGAVLAPVDRAWRGVAMSPSLQNVAANPAHSEGLYFCVPPNDQLLAKWDLVADRLFKIRHCQNIEGGALQLPLLSPPIDPAILVRARAMGVDIDSVLGQLYAPLPHYRFQLVLQKATELCGEVRSMGAALLSALEKRDGEALAVLRNTHELKLLEAVRSIKEQQLDESRQALAGLQRSRESAMLRQAHYERLLMEFMIPEEIAGTALGVASLLLQFAQMGAKFGAAAGGLVPNIKAGFVTTLGAMFGGQQIGDSAERAADAFGHIASILSASGGLITTMGGYRRRAEDWLLQAMLAGKELQALDRQIAGAEIRILIAESDLENQKLQIGNNRDVQAFMQDKFSSQALYDWMVGEVSSLHFQAYQMAFELARRSETAFAGELGVASPGIVKPGYWDSLKKGLLAGEHLYQDLKRLDLAYMDRNAREYELTRHVSVQQVDPLALLQLRLTGRCIVSLPETLFDMDCPGHYFRRIKTVAVSIPCVTGPYAGVACTLTLLKSSIRRSPALRDNAYARDAAGDDRFSDDLGGAQSVVTSSGQNDSGLFETNLRDERYLPFENSGAVSQWQLELPADPSRGDPALFDYATISDVVLHLRYTAREGGEPLRREAMQEAAAAIGAAQAAGCVRLFSVRQEFPSEWARFQGQAPAAGRRFELALRLRDEHYPFWSRGRLDRVHGLEILARSAADPVPASLDIFDSADSTVTASTVSLAPDAALGSLLVGRVAGAGLPASPVGELKFCLDDRALGDLWIAVTWGA